MVAKKVSYGQVGYFGYLPHLLFNCHSTGQNGIWVKFVLKLSLNICTCITIFFNEIHPCTKKVIFITEFVILFKNPPFYEVKKIFQERLSAWRNFKVIFSKPLLTIIFMPKMLKLDTYSIFTR